VTFAHQRADGGFEAGERPNGTSAKPFGAAVETAFFFLQELGRAILVIRESPYEAYFHDRIVALEPKARLARDGAMTLAIDGRIVGRGKASGLIARQPVEDFCVGHDNRQAVGDYVAPARFTGTIKGLKIANDCP